MTLATRNTPKLTLAGAQVALAAAIQQDTDVAEAGLRALEKA